MNNPGNRSSFLVLLLVLTALSIATAQTQLTPGLSISGGYSGYNPGGTASGVRFGRLPMGWTTTVNVKFTPRYSFVGDIGGYSDSKLGSTHTYLAGPRFTFHKGPFSPFAEVMMGAQRLAPKGQPSYVAFTEAAGGGMDVAIARGWSVRLFQADFIYAADHEKSKQLLNQFFGVRFSTGLVWNVSRFRRPVVASEKPNREKPASTAANATVAAAEPAAKPAAAPSETPSTDSASAAQPSSEVATAAPAPAPAALAPEAAKENAALADVPKPEPVNEDSAKKEVATVTPPSIETSPSAATAPSTAPAPEAPANPEAAPSSAAPAPTTAASAAPAKPNVAPSLAAPAAAETSSATGPATAKMPAAETPTQSPAASTPQDSPVVDAKSAAQPETAKAVPERTEVAKAQPAPVAEPSSTTPAAAPAAPVASVETPARVTSPATTAPAPSVPVIQQVANLRFPYDQYPTLLSTQDKRSLDALASRMKLEPQSKAVIVGSAPSRSGSLAAQRAVNSKDYLVQKGIAADRIEALERIPDSKPVARGTHSKTPAARTELLFVPAGASFDRAGASTVDEQKVKPEHLHVAHPEWHEK